MLEESERGRLARYAVLSGESLGRQYEEPEHDCRGCFQRDRDRVVHSAAFRRLDAKTQVFLEGRDYYRTRLTHTMEVALIARTLARTLMVNEDLAEAAALAHDLGHSPYGHCGEAVLNELMANDGGFEHNSHSLRVVTYLEHPYPQFRGLNLTFETRECLAKHESRYDTPQEQSEYGSGHAALEGQIADLADAIAYNSHDLDDALACGLINEEDLAAVELYCLLKEQAEKVYPGLSRFARQLRCAKGLIDLLVADVGAETARRLARLKPGTADDVREAKDKMVGYSAERRGQVRELEDFLLARVYKHERVARAQEVAREELTSLFNWYVNDVSLLPRRYRERVEQQGEARVVCDYLAGMTDRFCHLAYENCGRVPDGVGE